MKRFLPLFGMFFCIGSVIAQAEPPYPGARNAHALVWDNDRETLVLYGGADRENVTEDVWEWTESDGWRATELLALTPGKRTFPAFADLPGDGMAIMGGNRVLFGKSPSADTFLSDTWLWDGVGWSPACLANEPPPRAEASMIYDELRGQLVLFGGYRFVDGDYVRLGDSWACNPFDTSDGWSLITDTGPKPQNGSAMTFDPKHRVPLILAHDEDTSALWLLEGDRWERLGESIQRRFNPALAMNADTGVLTLFGGWTGQDRSADTMQYVHGAWRTLDVTGPDARNHSVLVDAGPRLGMLLYGGHDGKRIYNDFWQFLNGTWSKIAGTDPVKRKSNNH